MPLDTLDSVNISNNLKELAWS